MLRIVIACLACLAGSMVSSCVSSQGVRDIRLKDEDGNICDVVLPAMEFTERSEQYVLGKLLAEARTRIPEREVSISMLHRDCRITDDPRPRTVADDELLFAYQRPASPEARGELTMTLPRQLLSASIEEIAVGVSGAHVTITHRDGTRLHFVIGSEELVQTYASGFMIGRMTRQHYTVPDEFHDLLSSLPRQLSPKGATIGYAPERRLLAVIDTPGATTFRLLEALGWPRMDVDERKDAEQAESTVPVKAAPSASSPVR